MVVFDTFRLVGGRLGDRLGIWGGGGLDGEDDGLFVNRGLGFCMVFAFVGVAGVDWVGVGVGWVRVVVSGGCIRIRLVVLLLVGRGGGG